MTEQQPPSDSPEAILAAVGDDPEKAAAALTAENLRERPRKQLQARLFEIADPGRQASAVAAEPKAADQETVTYVNVKTGREVTYARPHPTLARSKAWKTKGEA